MEPSALPFERIKFSRVLEEGEADIEPFISSFFLPSKQDYPSCRVPISIGNLKEAIRDDDKAIAEYKYIWVIDYDGFRMILDKTPNPNARRGNVCHTNLTGGKSALMGGELWVDSNQTVYINFLSGRYGRGSTNEQKKGAIEYFEVYYGSSLEICY